MQIKLKVWWKITLPRVRQDLVQNSSPSQMIHQIIKKFSRPLKFKSPNVSRTCSKAIQTESDCNSRGCFDIHRMGLILTLIFLLWIIYFYLKSFRSLKSYFKFLDLKFDDIELAFLYSNQLFKVTFSYSKNTNLS